jgi:hypothetical protein
MPRPQRPKQRIHRPTSVRKYIEVRLKMLYDERAKNDNSTAHMVLDKSIYELHEVLDMIVRKTPLLHVDEKP